MIALFDASLSLFDLTDVLIDEDTDFVILSLHAAFLSFAILSTQLLLANFLLITLVLGQLLESVNRLVTSVTIIAIYFTLIIRVALAFFAFFITLAFFACFSLQDLSQLGLGNFASTYGLLQGAFIDFFHLLLLFFKDLLKHFLMSLRCWVDGLASRCGNNGLDFA